MICELLDHWVTASPGNYVVNDTNLPLCFAALHQIHCPLFTVLWLEASCSTCSCPSRWGRAGSVGGRWFHWSTGEMWSYRPHSHTGHRGDHGKSQPGGPWWWWVQAGWWALEGNLQKQNRKTPSTEADRCKKENLWEKTGAVVTHRHSQVVDERIRASRAEGSAEVVHVQSPDMGSSKIVVCHPLDLQHQRINSFEV